MNDYTDVILFLMQCNTDTQFIGSGEAAKAAAFYISEYITKNDLPLHVGLKALDYAIKANETKYFQNDQVCESTKDQSLITKAINSMMGCQETSHQQVMSYLVGGGDYYTNHVFKTLKFYEFLNALSDSEAAEGEDSQGHTDFDDPESNGNSEEQFIANIHHNGIEFTSEIADYTLRPAGKSFSKLSLWEFVQLTSKECGIPNDKHQNVEVDSSDTDQVSSVQPRGHKRAVKGQFLSGHLQYLSHCLRLCSKAVVPVLLGSSMPHNDRSEEEYESYCRAMLLLFKSWWNFAEIKGEYITWREAFEAHEFLPELLMIINNMNVENECKDA